MIQIYQKSVSEESLKNHSFYSIFRGFGCSALMRFFNFHKFFDFKHEICTGGDSQSKKNVKVDLER